MRIRKENAQSWQAKGVGKAANQGDQHNHYSRKIPLEEAIKAPGIFTARECQALQILADTLPELRKPIEAKHWQIPYVPSFIQAVAERLEKHCGLQIVGYTITDGSLRKRYYFKRMGGDNE